MTTQRKEISISNHVVSLDREKRIREINTKAASILEKLRKKNPAASRHFHIWGEKLFSDFDKKNYKKYINFFKIEKIEENDFFQLLEDLNYQTKISYKDAFKNNPQIISDIKELFNLLFWDLIFDFDYWKKINDNHIKTKLKDSLDPIERSFFEENIIVCYKQNEQLVRGYLPNFFDDLNQETKSDADESIENIYSNIKETFKKDIDNIKIFIETRKDEINKDSSIIDTLKNNYSYAVDFISYYEILNDESVLPSKEEEEEIFKKILDIVNTKCKIKLSEISIEQAIDITGIFYNERETIRGYKDELPIAIKPKDYYQGGTPIGEQDKTASSTIEVTIGNKKTPKPDKEKRNKKDWVVKPIAPHTGKIHVYREVVAQELYRLIISNDLQPKTRIQMGDFGVMQIASEQRDFMVSDQMDEILDEIRSDDPKENYQFTHAGEVIGVAIWVGENDLKWGNAALLNDVKIDGGSRRLSMIKIDSGQAFVLSHKKITRDIIRNLPSLHRQYKTNNFFDSSFINGNSLPDGMEERVLKNTEEFRLELNQTFLKILCLSDDFIKNFVNTYLLPQDYEQIGADMVEKLIERRNTLQEELINEEQFQSYIKNIDSAKFIDDFSNYLASFIPASKSHLIDNANATNMVKVTIDNLKNKIDLLDPVQADDLFDFMDEEEPNNLGNIANLSNINTRENGEEKSIYMTSFDNVKPKEKSHPLKIVVEALANLSVDGVKKVTKNLKEIISETEVKVIDETTKLKITKNKKSINKVALSSLLKENDFTDNYSFNLFKLGIEKISSNPDSIIDDCSTILKNLASIVSFEPRRDIAKFFAAFALQEVVKTGDFPDNYMGSKTPFDAVWNNIIELETLLSDERDILDLTSYINKLISNNINHSILYPLLQTKVSVDMIKEELRSNVKDLKDTLKKMRKDAYEKNNKIVGEYINAARSNNEIFENIIYGCLKDNFNQEVKKIQQAEMLFSHIFSKILVDIKNILVITNELENFANNPSLESFKYFCIATHSQPESFLIFQNEILQCGEHDLNDFLIKAGATARERMQELNSQEDIPESFYKKQGNKDIEKKIKEVKIKEVKIKNMGKKNEKNMKIFEKPADLNYEFKLEYESRLERRKDKEKKENENQLTLNAVTTNVKEDKQDLEKKKKDLDDTSNSLNNLRIDKVIDILKEFYGEKLYNITLKVINEGFELSEEDKLSAQDNDTPILMKLGDDKFSIYGFFNGEFHKGWKLTQLKLPSDELEVLQNIDFSKGLIEKGTFPDGLSKTMNRGHPAQSKKISDLPGIVKDFQVSEGVEPIPEGVNPYNILNILQTRLLMSRFNEFIEGLTGDELLKRQGENNKPQLKMDFDSLARIDCLIEAQDVSKLIEDNSKMIQDTIKLGLESKKAISIADAIANLLKTEKNLQVLISVQNSLESKNPNTMIEGFHKSSYTTYPKEGIDLNNTKVCEIISTVLTQRMSEMNSAIIDFTNCIHNWEPNGSSQEINKQIITLTKIIGITTSGKDFSERGAEYFTVIGLDANTFKTKSELLIGHSEFNIYEIKDAADNKILRFKNILHERERARSELIRLINACKVPESIKELERQIQVIAQINESCNNGQGVCDNFNDLFSQLSHLEQKNIFENELLRGETKDDLNDFIKTIEIKIKEFKDSLDAKKNKIQTLVNHLATLKIPQSQNEIGKQLAALESMLACKENPENLYRNGDNYFNDLNLKNSNLQILTGCTSADLTAIWEEVENKKNLFSNALVAYNKPSSILNRTSNKTPATISDLSSRSDAPDDLPKSPIVENLNILSTQENLTDLIQLANYYRKLCLLSQHSIYEFQRRQDNLSTYEKIMNILIQHVSHDSLLSSMNAKDDLFKEIKSFNDEFNSHNSPHNIIHFGDSFSILAEKDAANTVKTLLDNPSLIPASLSPDIFSGLISPYHARITKFSFDEPPIGIGLSVERFRIETDKDPTFVSESYLPARTGSPEALRVWACKTINRFFASAPTGTQRVTFEDGYKPEQLAALISYCNFAGFDFEVGKMQTFRILLHERKENKRTFGQPLDTFIDNIINKPICAKILNNKILDANFKNQVESILDNHQFPNDFWGNWEKIIKVDAYKTENWQSWLNSSVEVKNSLIPPLGKARRDELLTIAFVSHPDLKIEETPINRLTPSKTFRVL